MLTPRAKTVKMSDFQKAMRMRPGGMSMHEVEKQMERSLQLRTDPKFQEIVSPPLEEAPKTQEPPPEEAEDDSPERPATAAPAAAAPATAATVTEVRPSTALPKLARGPQPGVEGRYPGAYGGAPATYETEPKWHENIERKMKRLLVDFHLSEAPSCRLNHLDRLHDWHSLHGHKPGKNAKPAPHYIVVERSQLELPPGSTRNIDHYRTKEATAGLANIYPCRSPRPATRG